MCCHRFIQFFLLAQFVFWLIGCASSSTGSYDGVLSVIYENDTLTGSDNNYTNGVGLS